MVAKPNAIRASFVFFGVFLLAIPLFGLATPLVTVLFSSFALRFLHTYVRKPISILLFVVLVLTIFYGFVFFVRQAVTTLPQVANTSIPKIIEHASGYGIDLPFTDLHSLKVLAVDRVQEELKSVARFAEVATKEFVFLIIGLVIAIGIFVNPKLDFEVESHPVKNNLYSVFCSQLVLRFSRFYASFATVMGAQIIISTINTLCTTVFVLAIGLKFAWLIIVTTFLCGLLPIIGNIISNTIIFCIALTHSTSLAVLALVFLIVLHKGEYFLNSRIIGGRIRNPMWLTLTGLVVGECVMGIPGMILAPVLLHYAKMESLPVEVR